MRKIIYALATTALLAHGAVWAEDEVTTRTTKTVEEVTKGDLEDETFGIRPQLGIVNYTDTLDNSATRAIGGATFDMNAMTFVDPDLTTWYLGPSTGLLFSHLGSPDSNFFGTDSDIQGQQGANMFYIPLNLKAGYNFTDNFRVTVHGGGNLVYRSIASSMRLGTANSIGNDSDFTIFPNVGGDIEVGLGKNIALTLRPDVTITPGDEIFSGTLALAFPLSG